MVELLRSNDPVLLSFAASLLADAGIDHSMADTHMSIIEGSIGALPSRLLVSQERLDDATVLLTDAGIRV